LRIDFLHELEPLSNTRREALLDATRIYLASKMPKGEFIAWVSEVRGRIIGTSGLVLFERPPVAANLLGREAYIMNMYTVPEWRRQGVATALLQEILCFVKETGAERIWLHATVDGRSLYEKYGFVATSTEMELIWR
jgi:GNAT superfamily N-acetyltransferase